MGQQLSWGRHYLMVEPNHFRVDYAINPYMDLADQPDPVRALEQWHGLVEALRAAGAEVEVLPQRPDSPDMVYAMNLGLVVNTGPEVEDRRVVHSHMRYAERRNETLTAAPWFAEHGFAGSYVGRDGVGAHLEAGDAFAFGDALVVGYGPRTEELGLKHLATDLDVRVRGLRITHPGMYHLDLAFCPLDDRRAMVCPAALDEASAAAMLALVPEPLVLTEEEALTFCANSVVVGSTILMPSVPDRVRARLEGWGFEIVLVDVSEFHKGGGSVRCMTNPLDVVRGRDLPHVPGGEVVLP
jgi:N-dimethylarginine dimethylaminohydrolase